MVDELVAKGEVIGLEFTHFSIQHIDFRIQGALEGTHIFPPIISYKI